MRNIGFCQVTKLAARPASNQNISRTMARKKKVYQVAALIKAHEILDLLLTRGEATFTEIYTDLGQPKSSTYKTISTLESLGYIRSIGEGSRYALGLKLLELGSRAASQVDLFTEARPLVKRLSMETQRTCQIGILDGIDVVYVVKENTHCLIRLDTWVGKRIPVYCSSMGKVILAWMDEDAANDLLDHVTFDKVGPKTITDKKTFKNEFAQIRSRGWAMDDEESGSKIRNMSAPILNQNGTVCAALGISTLTDLEGKQELSKITSRLVDCARELSLRMGAADAHPAASPAI